MNQYIYILYLLLSGSLFAHSYSLPSASLYLFFQDGKCIDSFQEYRYLPKYFGNLAFQKYATANVPDDIIKFFEEGVQYEPKLKNSLIRIHVKFPYRSKKMYAKVYHLDEVINSNPDIKISLQLPTKEDTWSGIFSNYYDDKEKNSKQKYGTSVIKEKASHEDLHTFKRNAEKRIRETTRFFLIYDTLRILWLFPILFLLIRSFIRFFKKKEKGKKLGSKEVEFQLKLLIAIFIISSIVTRPYYIGELSLVFLLICLILLIESISTLKFRLRKP